MADAAVTAASVLSVTGATKGEFTAGAAIVAGNYCYQTNNSNQYWFPANSSNGLTVGAFSGVTGFALTSAPGAGQPVVIQRNGQIVLGTASLVAGAMYGISVNTGNIGSVKDRLTGEFPSFVGQAINTTTLQMATVPFSGNIALTTNA